MRSGQIILNNILRLFFFILVFLNGSYVSGQTVTLPDTNFRNVLLKYYPSVMSGNQLNIAAANSFTNDLFVRNANISDLTGVEHFTSVYKIDAIGNKISYIPDLSANQNLLYLYLNFNNLTYIDFALNNKSLLELQLFDNKLTHFPKLTGFYSLQKLYLSNNKITKIESVSELPNLTDLQIGNNLLDSLPDLSKNKKLISLHFHQNNIKDVSVFSLLPNIQYIYCWDNKITDLSALDDNTTLRALITSENELNDLPVLTNKPALTSLEITNNYLTFEDLLPIVDLSNLNTFSYAPQHAVGRNTFQSIRALNSLSLAIAEDKSVTTNIYTWSKNGNPVKTTSSGNFHIPVTAPSDSGVYTATITNPALPLLTLTHHLWKISIIPCMGLVSNGYRIVSKDCDEGTTIQTEILTDGSQLPLNYTLINITSKDSIISSSGIIKNIPPGEYMLKLTDQRNCRIAVDEKITIYNTAGCNPIIAPLTSSQESTYFIEGKGEVKIFDLQGNLIKTLIAPAIWDGTTSDGNLADAGYYVITLNNKKLTNISVLR